MRLLAPLCGTQSTGFIRRIRLFTVAAFGLACLLWPSSAIAQAVIAAPPAVSTIPPALQTPQNAPTESTNPWSAPPSFSEVGPLTFGPISLHPHFLYQYLDGTGVQHHRGQPLNTAINTFSPGFLALIGNHWSLDYTLTRRLYTNRAFHNSTDHAARLTGGTTYQDWDFNFLQTYILTNAPLAETGGQTKRETVDTNFGVGYHLNSRTLLQVSAVQDLRYVPAFQNTYEWSATGWLHYQYVQGLDTAVGLVAGYVDHNSSTSLSYNRYLARVGWNATQKLRFDLYGGVEVLNSRAVGGPDKTDPILTGTLTYQPFETTTLHFGADRSVRESYYFANQIVKATRWNAGLRQRLLGHFYLSADYTDTKSSYVAIAQGVVAGREDRVRRFEVRLSVALLRHGTVAVLYNTSRDSSNLAGYSFLSHQFGVEAGYRF